MRILVCTKPAPGHVNPVLPLAEELAARGHDVAWYTGSAFEQAVEAHGAMYVPVRAAPDFYGTTTVDEFRARVRSDADELRGIAAAKFDLKHLCHDVAALELEDLSSWLGSHPVDIVVCDPTILGAIYACERYDIACAVIGMTVLAFHSRDTAPAPLGLRPRAGALGHVRNRVLYALMDTLLMRDVNRYGNQVRARIGLPPSSAGFFDIALEGCGLWLQPTTPDFEYPRSDLPDRVRFVGPMLPPTSTEFEAPSWWAMLDQGRPVVLVTQGTVRSDPGELIEPTLEALSNDDDVLVIATTGGNEISSPVPANTRVADYLPYHHLLPHVDVMVTNAGYGGVHFALAYGVPLVAAGRTEEKAEIGARIAWSGVGVDLRRHSPSPRRIRRAVHQVLGDQRYRERSRAIGGRFAGFDAPRHGADLLEDLAHRGR